MCKSKNSATHLPRPRLCDATRNDNIIVDDWKKRFSDMTDFDVESRRAVSKHFINCIDRYHRHITKMFEHIIVRVFELSRMSSRVLII